MDRPNDTDAGSHTERRYRELARELIRQARRSAASTDAPSPQTSREGAPKRSPASGPLLRLRVRGRSMAPLLRPGDTVWMEPAAPSSLKRGDLVVVQRAGEWVTHRLVARSGNRWHTKGDNLRYPDPPVTGQAILGRVVAIERNGLRIELQGHRWRMINRALGWIGWLETRCFTAAQWSKRHLFGGELPPALRVLSRLVTAPPRWCVRLVRRKLSERVLG